MSRVIDINLVAEDIKQELTKEINDYVEAGYRAPQIKFLMVGTDISVMGFMDEKRALCESFGITPKFFFYPNTISQEEMDLAVDEVSQDTDGIIVSLPLPSGLTLERLENYADKDIDSFTCINLDKLTAGERCYIPATPYGVIILLEHEHLISEGKHILFIRKNEEITQPIIDILSKNPYKATVSQIAYNAPEEELNSATSNADIILVVDKELDILDKLTVKNDAVLINLKTSESVNAILTEENYAILHDNCLHIAPIPGGAGPMTDIAFVKNTMKSYKTIYIPAEDAARKAAKEEEERLLAEFEARRLEEEARMLAEEAAEMARDAEREKNIENNEE